MLPHIFATSYSQAIASTDAIFFGILPLLFGWFLYSIFSRDIWGFIFVKFPVMYVVSMLAIENYKEGQSEAYIFIYVLAGVCAHMSYMRLYKDERIFT